MTIDRPPIDPTLYILPRRLGKNLEGRTFGRLFISGLLGSKSNRLWWRCTCKCGTESAVATSSLLSGNTTSCGCLTTDNSRAASITHGKTHTVEYSAWTAVVGKCLNSNHGDFKYYGARGIKVSEAWAESFEQFLADMGKRPDGLTLERLDTDGGYCKENCVWATRKTQTRNRRTTVTATYLGETKPLAEWAELYSIPYTTLKARVSRLGYSIEDALHKPIQYGMRLEGKEYQLRKKPDMSNVARGFNAPQAKMTIEKARAMQKKYDLGGASFSSLAREYAVSVETASRVCQRESFYGEIDND